MIKISKILYKKIILSVISNQNYLVKNRSNIRGEPYLTNSQVEKISSMFVFNCSFIALISLTQFYFLIVLFVYCFVSSCFVFSCSFISWNPIKYTTIHVISISKNYVEEIYFLKYWIQFPSVNGVLKLT